MDLLPDRRSEPAAFLGTGTVPESSGTVTHGAFPPAGAARFAPGGEIVGDVSAEVHLRSVQLLGPRRSRKADVLRARVHAEAYGLRVTCRVIRESDGKRRM